MAIIGFILVLVAVLAVGAVIAGQMGMLSGKAPSKLGVKDGRLKPPSKTPNSVSSQADLHPEHPQRDFARIAPLKFTGDGAQAMEKLASLLSKRERTTVVTQGPDYIYAQSTTALMKYTDDVEFMLDKSAGVIHVRSSSRLGRKDFDVNRARVEAIRTEFSKP